MRLQLSPLWRNVITCETELENIQDPIRLRIEIFVCSNNKKLFRIRTRRYDLFRVKPTSSALSSDGENADHELLVDDPLFEVCEISAKSAEDALREAVKKIKYHFKMES